MTRARVHAQALDHDIYNLSDLHLVKFACSIFTQPAVRSHGIGYLGNVPSTKPKL